MNSSGRESLIHDTFRYSNVENDTMTKTSPKERQSFGVAIKGSIFKQESTTDGGTNVRKSLAFEPKSASLGAQPLYLTDNN